MYVGVYTESPKRTEFSKFLVVFFFSRLSDQTLSSFGLQSSFRVSKAAVQSDIIIFVIITTARNQYVDTHRALNEHTANPPNAGRKSVWLVEKC